MDFRFLTVLLLLGLPQWSMATIKKYSEQKTTYVQASPLNEQIAQPVYQPPPAPVNVYRPQVIDPGSAANLAPATTTKSPSVEQKDSWKFYLALLGGYIDQFEATNVIGNGAGGAGLGIELANGLAFEGSFLYGNLTSTHTFCRLSNARCGQDNTFDVASRNNIDQFYSSLGAKYTFDFGFFVRPSIGALAAYNYREHEPMSTSNITVTQAFDVGASLGADVVLTDWLRLGLDWRFMANVAYQQEGESLVSNLGLREVPTNSGKNLVDYEATSYQVWMGSIKLLF